MATGQVLGAMLRSWTGQRSGRALLIGWSATFGLVSLRAAWLRRKAKKALLLAPPKPDVAIKPAAPVGPSAFMRIYRIAVPGWKSAPVRWCALLSVGIGLRLAVSIKTSQEIGVLGSLLAKRDWSALYRRQLTYALVSVPAALTAALQKYAATGAALAMRRNLTAALHQRYGDSASLTSALSTDEAEGGVQRGTADVAAYCNDAVGLFQGLFKPAVRRRALSRRSRRGLADDGGRFHAVILGEGLLTTAGASSNRSRWCCSRANSPP
jgi:ATP-binding cassette subfamily D (ALD) long-chain fatty acid import protein